MLNFNLFWGCIQGRPQNISLSALKSYYFLSWGKSMTENFWISWFDRKSVCIPPMQASWQDYRYQVHSRFLNKSRYTCGISGFCFDRISHILFVWSIESRPNRKSLILPNYIMKGCSHSHRQQTINYLWLIFKFNWFAKITLGSSTKQRSCLISTRFNVAPYIWWYKHNLFFWRRL